MKLYQWLTVLGVGLASNMLAAESSTRSRNPEKLVNSGCVLAIEEDSIAIGNSLGKITWTKQGGFWRASFFSRNDHRWVKVADDGGYGLLFPDSGGNGGIHMDAPGDTELAHIPENLRPTILSHSADRIEIRWEFEFQDSKQRQWSIGNTYAIEKGNRFIDESVTFQGPLTTKEREIRCRLQRAWDCRELWGGSYPGSLGCTLAVFFSCGR